MLSMFARIPFFSSEDPDFSLCQCVWVRQREAGKIYKEMKESVCDMYTYFGTYMWQMCLMSGMMKRRNLVKINFKKLMLVSYILKNITIMLKI